jgi:hypothetical protein
VTVPLYGFLEGDSLGLLMLASEGMTVAELADSLRAAAAVRVGWTGDAHVLHAGRVVAGELTVARAQMRPLDRFDVRRGLP